MGRLGSGVRVNASFQIFVMAAKSTITRHDDDDNDDDYHGNDRDV